MKNQLIALFGEAEKGSFTSLIHIKSLAELCEKFGHPPENSYGINLAIQTLLYERELLFIRVQEEGFSFADYLQGIQLLEKATMTTNLSAICLPGVGDHQIIEPTFKLCEQRGSLLITNQKDLYDYLTGFHQSA